MKNFFGTSAFILTMFIQLPQAFKVLRTKRTRDISLMTYSLILLASASWIFYGMATNTAYVLYANLVVFILALIVFVSKLRFG